MKVVQKEGIKCSVSDLETITNNNYPDVRKMLNTIQVSTQNNQLKLDKDVLVSNNYMVKVVEELAKSSPKFNEIRQIIANANVKDFEVFYRFLFDKASEYAPGKEGTVAVHINEYSFQSNFRIDKEINCMALINQLINLK